MIERKYIALVSDQHVTEPATKLVGRDTNAAVQKLVEALKQETLPELFLSLGDVADTAKNPNRFEATATEESYRLAQDMLSELSLPKLTVAGNHDHPQLLDEAFPSLWHDARHGVARFPFHGVEIVRVDARTGPEATGFVSREALKELERVLESIATKAILVCHYPLVGMDNGFIDSDLSVTNRDQLAPLFYRYKDKIAGIYSGHLHEWIAGSQGGLPVTSVPSSSFGFKLEPMTSQMEVSSSAPCGYLLLGVGEDGSVLSRYRFLKGVTAKAE